MLKAVTVALLITSLHAETTTNATTQPPLQKAAKKTRQPSSAQTSSSTNADVDMTLNQIEAALARQTETED